MYTIHVPFTNSDLETISNLIPVVDELYGEFEKTEHEFTEEESIYFHRCDELIGELANALEKYRDVLSRMTQ